MHVKKSEKTCFLRGFQNYVNQITCISEYFCLILLKTAAAELWRCAAEGSSKKQLNFAKEFR